jgi:hypothetical protein
VVESVSSSSKQSLAGAPTYHTFVGSSSLLPPAKRRVAGTSREAHVFLPNTDGVALKAAVDPNAIARKAKVVCENLILQ